jgi:hypothetical protein
MGLKAVATLVPGGGPPVGGSGTPGKLAKFTGATTLGDSLLSESGTTITSAATAETFGSAQTWTLATGTSALKIQSGLLNLDTTNSRVGIGTASPTHKLQVVGELGLYNAGVDAVYGDVLFMGAAAYQTTFRHKIKASISATATSSLMTFSLTSGASTFIDVMTLRGDGNVGIGTTSPTDRLTISGGGLAITGNITGATTAASTLVMDAIGSTSRFFSIGANAASFGNYVFYASKSGGSPGAVVVCTIDQAAGVLLGTTSTAVFNASTLGQGLKLPATPGNADTQTLDCYAEGTWAPTLTGFGGTAPTVTAARYTRIGRLVSIQLHLAAVPATTFSSAAGGTFVSLPAGMTPPVSAPGATSNSGIAADGPCVAYTNGNFYLPTFALRAADTFLNVTYTV